MNIRAITSFLLSCTFLFSINISGGFLSAGEPTIYYVAPDGNDSWSGKLKAPNPDGTDGPFASLEGARDAIRRLKKRGPLAAPVVVKIRTGLYHLDKPFVLEPVDSGTTDCPITYTAEGPEKPVFTGGRAITGWKRGPNGVWTVKLPRVKAGEWYFRSLFVNGRRRTRARMPNKGYFHAAGKAPPTTDSATGKKVSRERTAFRFKPGDIKKWERLEDANLVTFHSWTTSRFFIKSLDTINNIVEVYGRCRYTFLRWDKAERYYIENIPEALDAPGEWYLDRRTGILSYIPYKGEDPTKEKVVAPVLKQLVVFRGEPEKGRFIEHITISGLSFLYTDWEIGRDGHSYSQSAIDGKTGIGVTPAVALEGARHCNLTDLEIAHTGGYAVSFGRGCKYNIIERCHIHDLAAGGVLLGMSRLPKDEHLRSNHNTVYNCFIHDGGHVYASGVGVWIGRSSYNVVKNNEICDFFYTGVSAGWSWGYAPSSAHHNLIENNHIHHLGYGVLSDMGGIYTLGRSPGTKLLHNLIHHVESYSYGGWGIYPDEGSSDILIKNNIVYRTKTGGFHQHYGKENIVENNIFAFSRERGQIIRTRAEKHRSFVFERNIVFYNQANLLGGNWSGNNYKLDYNDYWNDSGSTVTFAGKSFDEWKKKGQDVHSIIADPKFYAPYKYDFRLRADSPALKLGFKPIETKGIGLVGPREWVDLPKKVKRNWPRDE